VTAASRAVDTLAVRAEGDLLHVSATKVVDPTDAYLTGHFPGFAIYPGVFFIETLEQAVAGALPGRPRLTVLRSARFTAPVLDGDRLRMELTIDHSGQPVLARARCYRGDGTRCADLVAEFDGGCP